MLTSAEVRALAPEAFAALDTAATTAERTGDALLRGLLRRHIAGLLGAEAVPIDLGKCSNDERDVLGFAEQFVLDVGGTGVDQRRRALEALAALGEDPFEFVMLCYVADWTVRTGAAWRQLFDADCAPDLSVPAAPSLWEAIDASFRAIARQNELDPITTELVRLRGARAHNCRLCKSLRSSRAAAAGATEQTYAMIDEHATSDLSRRHRIALQLVDALIWQPVAFPSGLVDSLHDQFTPAQLVELVLDAARNAGNKIAVALGVDAAHVTEGVEHYDIDAAGTVVYQGF
ncbi:MAG TPA: carboxymuconolactone decarboxylase family protein [Acidimicrobiia bacterium]|nr:carboxymuconolactone decarboxylase family protein [Acidimicrobiia bacterium]